MQQGDWVRRLSVGLPLALLLGGMLLFAPSELVLVLMGLIIVLAGYEWGELSGRNGILSAAVQLFVLGALWFLTDLFPTLYFSLFVLLACAWIYAIYEILATERAGSLAEHAPWSSSFAFGSLLLSGTFVSFKYLLSVQPSTLEVQLPSAWLGIAFSRWLLLWVVSTVALADIGGYIAGKVWGKRQLVPVLSKGKTWEGMVGAFVLGMLPGFVLLLVLDWLFGIVLVCFAAALVGFSLYGDLWESMAKRYANVKDSGRLLPGHGGILDRLDSHLLAFALAACVIALRALLLVI
ncbi:MAG: phosphatidate cytidylyltransferase [Gammaproteobacteria bacterium]